MLVVYDEWFNETNGIFDAHSKTIKHSKNSWKLPEINKQIKRTLYVNCHHCYLELSFKSEQLSNIIHGRTFITSKRHIICAKGFQVRTIISN